MDDWVVTVKYDLQRMAIIRTVEKRQLYNRSIFKVPASVVTDLNMKSYKPQFVSFGPNHHGEVHLMPMEEHMHRALLHFLKRSHKPLESYVNSLAEVAQILKDSYDSLDPTWERDTDTDRFLQLMILDGFFMLEVLRYNIRQVGNDYAVNDPIFSNIIMGGFTLCLVSNGTCLCLKINSLCFFSRFLLLKMRKLRSKPPGVYGGSPEIRRACRSKDRGRRKSQGYNKGRRSSEMDFAEITSSEEAGDQDEEFVNKLILQFCYGNIRFAAYPSMGKCLHLLDVHRKILLWPDAKGSHQTKSWWRWNILSCLMGQEAGAGDKIIWSAIEMYEAGISLKKSKSQSLQDISLEGGELSRPLCIIRSAKDVNLLHDKGIIQNALGSDEAMAELFNSITKDATIDQASSLDLELLHKRVDKHCKHWLITWCSKWRFWLANPRTRILGVLGRLSLWQRLSCFSCSLYCKQYSPSGHPNDSPTLVSLQCLKQIQVRLPSHRLG
ncbi:hypothetical protein RHSIM_Rhsim12G0118000 [Rhododendron simsii]|uniref:Uncharacterized protein n=1 Tax=Rhododendron simsii TaxID=118357 RepID=A0A834G1W7_RHOSS|nr:hypothetical protein RHSIM_Rhsim12G0118000 [Rhododendron simsii]